MPEAPLELPPLQPDENQQVIERLFGEMLIHPRSEIAEEILKTTRVIKQTQTLADFTDIELTAKIQEAAQIIGDKKSGGYNSKLAEEIANNYRG